MAVAQSGAAAIDATKAAALAAGARLGVQGAKAYQDAQAQLNQSRAAELATLGGVGSHAGFDAGNPVYSGGINQAAASRQAALSSGAAAFAGANRIGEQSIGDYLDATKASLGNAVAWAKAQGSGGGGGSGKAAKSPFDSMTQSQQQSYLLGLGSQARDQLVGSLLHQAHAAQITGGSAAARGLATPDVNAAGGQVGFSTDRAENDFRGRQAALGRFLSLETTQQPNGTEIDSVAAPPRKKGGILGSTTDPAYPESQTVHIVGPKSRDNRYIDVTRPRAGAPSTSPAALAQAARMQAMLQAELDSANTKSGQQFGVRDKATKSAQGYATTPSASFARQIAINSGLSPTKVDALLSPKVSTAYEASLAKARGIDGKTASSDPFAAALDASHLGPGSPIDPRLLTLPTYVVPKGTRLSGNGLLSGTATKSVTAKTDAELATALGLVDKQGNPDTTKITAAIRKKYLAGSTPLNSYLQGGIGKAAGDVSDPFGFATAPSQAGNLGADVANDPRIASLLSEIAAPVGYDTYGNPLPAASSDERAQQLAAPQVGDYVNALIQAALANRQSRGTTAKPADALWNYYLQNLFR